MSNLPFFISGTVTHGRKLGSEFNMPTANIVPNEDVSDLAFGVYYSKAYIDDKVYKSISNLGTKPTVQDDNLVNAETFLYDFEGDIYGKKIKVELLEFKRPEMKFASLEDLRTQMRRDLDEGEKY